MTAAPEKLPAIRPYTSRVRLSWRLGRGACRIIGKLYFRVSATGLENFPASGPCLLLSTHTSFLDPVLVGIVIDRETHYLARPGVTYAPLMGALCRLYNTHAIRRTGIDRGAIKTCIAVLRAGWPLTMFPEGTRSPNGEMQPPKWGFAMIIESMPETLCIPIYIEGSDRALGRGMIFPRPRRIVVHYGKAFRFEPKTEDQSRREFYAACVDRLSEEWRRTQAEAVAPPDPGQTESG